MKFSFKVMVCKKTARGVFWNTVYVYICYENELYDERRFQQLSSD